MTHKIYLYLFLLCLCNFTLNAQKTTELSLSQAIRIGLKNNLQIDIAKSNQRVIASDLVIKKTSALPRIDFKIRQRNRISIDNSPTSFVEGTYASTDLSANIDGQWVLFDGFRLRTQKEGFKHLAKQAKGHQQLIVENTIHAIILAYYEALIEQEKLQVVQAVKALSEATFENAKILKANGNISQFELLSFKNAFLTDSIRVQTQNITTKQSLLQLNAAINISPTKVILLKDKFKSKTNAYDYTYLKKRLVNKNQDIKNQYFNIALIENRIALEGLAKKPKLSASGNISQDISFSRFADEEVDQGSVTDFYLGFSFAFNLYDGGAMKHTIQKLEIEKHIASLEVETMKQKLENELYIAHQAYTNQKAILSTHDLLIETQKASLEIAQERLNSGYSTALEFRSLQLDYLQANLNKLELLFALKVSELNLTRLTGGLVRYQK